MPSFCLSTLGVKRVPTLTDDGVSQARALGITGAAFSFTTSDGRFDLSIVLKSFKREGESDTSRQKAECQFLGFFLSAPLHELTGSLAQRSGAEVQACLLESLTLPHADPYHNPLYVADKNTHACYKVLSRDGRHVSDIVLARTSTFHSLKAFPVLKSEEPCLVLATNIDRNALLPSLPTADDAWTGFLTKLAAGLRHKWSLAASGSDAAAPPGVVQAILHRHSMLHGCVNLVVRGTTVRAAVVPLTIDAAFLPLGPTTDQTALVAALQDTFPRFLKTLKSTTNLLLSNHHFVYNPFLDPSIGAPLEKHADNPASAAHAPGKQEFPQLLAECVAAALVHGGWLHGGRT